MDFLSARTMEPQASACHFGQLEPIPRTPLAAEPEDACRYRHVGRDAAEEVYLQLDQPVAQSGDDSVRPIIGLQLAYDGTRVVLHRTFGQKQPGSDLLVR